jgi:hypothetical protein
MEKIVERKPGFARASYFLRAVAVRRACKNLIFFFSQTIKKELSIVVSFN